MRTDLFLITEKRYCKPTELNDYINNILLEDKILSEELAKKDIKSKRVDWSDPNIDWSEARHLLFRTPWDYHKRYGEFTNWMKKMNERHQLINPSEIVPWNIDKSYLLELERKGIRIPATKLFKQGQSIDLQKEFRQVEWKKAIIKPCISAAARDTHVITDTKEVDYQSIVDRILKNEDILLQEFQENVLIKGELSLMFFGGKYTHTVIKKAKKGDFRVQDDFGGSVESHVANSDEIDFAKSVLNALDFETDYARVDLLWNNQNELVLSEIELIEPELWFRLKPEAATIFAAHLKNKYF